jgi:hypothetical protein
LVKRRKKKTNVSRTISVLVFRVLMYLEKQSAPGIGLPEFHAHEFQAHTWTVKADTYIGYKIYVRY